MVKNIIYEIFTTRNALKEKDHQGVIKHGFRFRYTF